MNYGKDYTGQKFGRLTAVLKTSQTDVDGKFLWLFECECGGTTTTHISKVKRGHTNSCGWASYVEQRHNRTDT